MDTVPRAPMPSVMASRGFDVTPPWRQRRLVSNPLALEMKSTARSANHPAARHARGRTGRSSKNKVVLTSCAEKARLARDRARAPMDMFQGKTEQEEARLADDLGSQPDFADMVDHLIRDAATAACDGHPPTESTATDDPDSKVARFANESWRAGGRRSNNAAVLTPRAEKERLARDRSRAPMYMPQARSEKTEAHLTDDLGYELDFSDAVDHLIRDAAAAAHAEPPPAESTAADDPDCKVKWFAYQSWRAGNDAQFASAGASASVGSHIVAAETYASL